MDDEEAEANRIAGWRVYWISEDSLVQVIQYLDDQFGLEYRGVEVCQVGTFEQITYYYWEEFATWDESLE